MEQARVAICHAFDFEFKSETDRFRPTYIFSIPEVAGVGMTEEQVRTAGIDYEVGRCSFATNAKARISGFPDGLVKLVFVCPTRCCWACIFSEKLASELIHIGQFVMQAEARSTDSSTPPLPSPPGAKRTSTPPTMGLCGSPATPGRPRCASPIAVRPEISSRIEHAKIH